MLCEKFDVKEQTGAKKALDSGLKTVDVPLLLNSASPGHHDEWKILTSRKRIQGQAVYVKHLLAC